MMTKFLAASYATSLIGQFIGLAQSRQANDPLREKVRAAYNDFNERLRVAGVIDSHTVQCDLRNNSVPSIVAGVLNVGVIVAYMAIVDRIVVTLTGGQTVKITTQPQQLTAKASPRVTTERGPRRGLFFFRGISTCQLIRRVASTSAGTTRSAS